jgi:hypothetical protein
VFIFYTDNLDRINALKIAVGHVYVPMLYKLELSIFRFAECYGNIAGLREELQLSGILQVLVSFISEQTNAT